MGRKLVLTGTKLTDLNAPKLARIDPIESPGSMLLIEPGHPINPWDGVPGDGATVPNLFAENAASVMGVAPADANLSTLVTDFDGNRGLAERSARGGLNLNFSQTNNDAGLTAYAIGRGGTQPTAFQRWLYANDQEAYKNTALYTSLWANVTRSHRTASQVTDIMTIGTWTSTTGRYRQRFGYTAVPTASTPPNQGNAPALLGRQDANTTSTGLKRMSIATRGYRGELPINEANVAFLPFYLGNNGTVNTYQTARGASASLVFYRVYVENLDISGRTYAEVDAIDAELHAAAFGPGGRYADDTYTNPATLP